MKVPLFIVICCLFSGSSLALTSICPTTFQYKTTTLSAAEYQSWSAVVYLPQVYGTSFNADIILDRSVSHFSAHNYQVMTSDSKKFHLSSSGRNQTSISGTQSEANRIYITVEFTGQTVPLVDEIRCNGVRICPVATTSGGNGGEVRQNQYPGSSSTSTTMTTNRRTTPSPNSREFIGSGGVGGGRATPTTERINYLANNNNNRRVPEEENARWPVNSNSGDYYPGSPTASSSATTSRQPGFNSATAATTSASQYDDWNLNTRQTTTRRIPTGGASTRGYSSNGRTTTTTTTTSSPYFGGDLHMIFQSNGNDRRRVTENPLSASDPCGVLSPSLNPLVVNGAAAHEGQFPWHAALYISQGVQLKYTCGGNLVSNRLVLTAAHCVTLKRTASPMNPEHLLVYLGKSDLLHWQGNEQDFSVEEIVIHPEYNYTRFYSDMALLKLKKDSRYTDHVRPVCLWASDDLKQVVGKVGRVPGWGYNENGVVGTELSYVEMPIVTHETCIWSNRDVFSRITSDTSFCAGFRNGSNVCNGDSGGGMVFFQGGRWYLKGIVSVSLAIQNHFLCDPDHYVVFGDVSKFRAWVERYF